MSFGRSDRSDREPDRQGPKTPASEQYTISKIPSMKELQIALRNTAQKLFYMCDNVGERATDDIMAQARRYVTLAAACTFNDTRNSLRATTWHEYIKLPRNGWLHQARAIFPDLSASSLWPQHYKVRDALSEAARFAVLNGLKTPRLHMQEHPSRFPTVPPPPALGPQRTPTSAHFPASPWDVWKPFGLTVHDTTRNQAVMEGIKRERKDNSEATMLDIFVRGLTRALQLTTADQTAVYTVSVLGSARIRERNEAKNTNWGGAGRITLSTSVLYPFCVTTTSPLSLFVVTRSKDRAVKGSVVYTSDTHTSRQEDIIKAASAFTDATFVGGAWDYKGVRPPLMIVEFPITSTGNSRHAPALVKIAELVFAGTEDGVSAGLPNFAKQIGAPLIRVDDLTDNTIHRVMERGYQLATATNPDADAVAAWLMWIASRVVAHNTLGRMVKGTMTPRYKMGDQPTPLNSKRRLVDNATDANKRPQHGHSSSGPRSSSGSSSSSSSSCSSSSFSSSSSSSSSGSSSSSSSSSIPSSGSSSGCHSNSGPHSTSVTPPSPYVSIVDMQAEYAELKRRVEDLHRREWQAKIDELKQQLGERAAPDPVARSSMTLPPDPESKEPETERSTAPVTLTPGQVEEGKNHTPEDHPETQIQTSPADGEPRTRAAWGSFTLGDRQPIGEGEATLSDGIVFDHTLGNAAGNMEVPLANTHRFQRVLVDTDHNSEQPPAAPEVGHTDDEHHNPDHHSDDNGSDEDDSDLSELCPGMDPRHPLASIHGETAHDDSECLQQSSKFSLHEDDRIDSPDTSDFCAFCLTQVAEVDIYDHFPKFFILEAGDGICYADLDNNNKPRVDYVGCSGQWCFKRQRLMKLWTAKFGKSVVPIQELQRQHRDSRGRRSTK